MDKPMKAIIISWKYFCFLNLGKTKYLIMIKENKNPKRRRNPKNKFPEIKVLPIQKLEFEDFRKIPIVPINKANNPINKKFPERPSRYKTKTNPTKTNIVPASGCRMINKAGIMTNNPALILVLKS